MIEPAGDSPSLTATALASGAAPGAAISQPPEAEPIGSRPRVYISDVIMAWLARGSAVVVLLMMASLLIVLTKSAIPSIKKYGAGFLTSSVWRANEKFVTVTTPDGTPVRANQDLDGKVKPPDAKGLYYDLEGNPVEVNEDTGKFPILKKRVAPEFGALPVIYGTFVSSIIALLFAVPLSLGAALFLVRIAPRPLPGYAFAMPIAVAVALFACISLDINVVLRVLISVLIGLGVWFGLKSIPPLKLTGIMSFLIEFLAAIPSIAFGIWGLFKLKPFLDKIEPPLNSFFAHTPGLKWLAFDQGLTGKDMLCGGLILGIMILPIITAISRDVLSAVPRIQIEGTQALGATWWQSSFEMLRYSRSGLFGAVILGLARAAGETMAVTMVIGNSMIIYQYDAAGVRHLIKSPFAPSQTMASLLANQFGNPENAEHTSAMLEVALILLLMSLSFNVLARWLVVGKQTRTA